MRLPILKFIKFPIVILSELLLLAIFYLSGVYKSVFFQSIFSAISKLSIFSQLRSLLILVVMMMPIFALLYVTNLKLIKLPVKIIVISQLIVVISILTLLEIILRLV